MLLFHYNNGCTNAPKYYVYTQWRTQEFCSGGGFNKFRWGQTTENGDLGAVAPYTLAKGSGGSCNLVQEISFHIVKVT